MQPKRQAQGFQDEVSGLGLPNFSARVTPAVSNRALRTYRGEGPAAVAALKSQTGVSPELIAIRGQVNFKQVVLPYSTVSTLVLPGAARSYFLIQNLSATEDMAVGFDFNVGAGVAGLIIGPGEAYEPIRIPQEDVYVAGTAAGTFCMIYGIAQG